MSCTKNLIIFAVIIISFIYISNKNQENFSNNSIETSDKKYLDTNITSSFIHDKNNNYVNTKEDLLIPTKYDLDCGENLKNHYVKSINEDNSFHFKYEASPVIEDEIDDENFDEELDDISEFIHPEKSIVFNQPSIKNKLVKKLSIDEFNEKPALNQSNFSVIEYEKDLYIKHGKGTSLSNFKTFKSQSKSIGSDYINSKVPETIKNSNSALFVDNKLSDNKYIVDNKKMVDSKTKKQMNFFNKHLVKDGVYQNLKYTNRPEILEASKDVDFTPLKTRIDNIIDDNKSNSTSFKDIFNMITNKKENQSLDNKGLEKEVGQSNFSYVNKDYNLDDNLGENSYGSFDNFETRYSNIN